MYLSLNNSEHVAFELFSPLTTFIHHPHPSEAIGNFADTFNVKQGLL